MQTSSEIRGRLKPGWPSTFCADLLRMLPAGSISGAPKQKTLEIIAANETAPRGYYTGIFGLFQPGLCSKIRSEGRKRNGSKGFVEDE
ncbi:MAG TPA: chorismate-binding protein [Flavobacteriales bacterium]|nr:chorismate-binding protein [Flavobacteriales bacterium]